MKAVILAGGSGTRLWPMSRMSRPKQFFDVIGERMLIQDTYDRLRGMFADEDIYFSVSPAFVDLVKTSFPNVSQDRIIVEPDKRDTGPAMGYVAAILEMTNPDEPIVFVPSDHYIGDAKRFLQCLQLGDELIRETGKLLDIAIKPSFPSTALGYTRVGEKIKVHEGIEVFSFLGHTEKPAYPVAKAYVEDGSYLWHANYYMWTPRKFVEAFEKHAPDIGVKLRAIQKASKEDDVEGVQALYASLPKTSIDYAVTENMAEGEVLIIAGDFGWSDIGAWDTLQDQLSEEPQNVTKGEVMLFDTTRSLVYGQAEKLIAVVGMEGVIVVDTEDVLLVCNRMSAQRVKEVVQKLKEEGKDMYL